jgi:hypothetical protein
MERDLLCILLNFIHPSVYSVCSVAKSYRAYLRIPSS